MVTINLDIDKLSPNPDNPRKELGDLAELSESIKQNGILQPLRVFSADNDMNSFVVLIGHRRLAAAKLAGLKEVPCTVDMKHVPDKSEQMAIMLQENINRSSLTAKEEADGFQYMLDLGETAQTISEKTGFSVSTVRRRLKVAELDAGAIRKAQEGFNLQLSDYDKLGQLKDPKARDKVLNESQDRENFEYNIKQALRKQKDDESIARWSKTAKELSIPKGGPSVHSYSSNYDQVCSFKATEEGIRQFEADKFEKGYDPMEWEEKCCWVAEYGTIYIMRKSVEQAKPAKDKKTAEERLAEVQRRQDVNQLKEDMKAMKERIAECFAMMARGELKAQMPDNMLLKEAWDCLVESSVFLGYTNMMYAFLEKDVKGWTAEDMEKVKKKAAETDTLHQIYAVLASQARDIYQWITPVMFVTGDQPRAWLDDEKVKKTCRALQLLSYYGFSINETEESIISGTHRGLAYA